MKNERIQDLAAEDRGVLRFLTCGSVDDGKSTLIGRLLFDTKALLSDTIDTLNTHAQRKGLSAPDLSLLTDGLVAEREQGITIDVAYRYFATGTRKFIIADSPGHEQYTRNMVTAASTADVAVLLVDARKGILPQTRRHATIAALLGIRQLILAVNKMDLVGWSQQTFDLIVADFQGWLAQHPELIGTEVASRLHAVPMSALEGDMVVDRGDALAWYSGPTLVELLEGAPAGQTQTHAPLRFPVQWVCRPSQSDLRGYAGRIESGALAVGDSVTVLPAGPTTTVAAITLGEQSLPSAVAGQSVMVQLTDERDISRGDLLVRTGDDSVSVKREFQAIVCWLNAAPLSPSRSYAIRHASRETKARVAGVEGRLDIHTLEWGSSSDPVGLNDIARLMLKVQQPLVIDAYRENRATGAFILVDEATHETVAAGVVQ